MRLLRVAAAGLALAVPLACNRSQDASGEPPPEGLPWLGHVFDVQLRVAGETCEGRGAPWALRQTTATLDQSGRTVTLTFADETDTAVRPVVLHGCVVGAADTGIELRLTGTTRSAVTQGQTSCTVRMAFPAALGEEIDHAEAAADLSGEATTNLGSSEDAWIAAGCPNADEDADKAFAHVVWRVCEDGALRGDFDAQLAFTGYACHAGTPCTLRLGAEAAVAEPHPDAPVGALLGGVCD